MVGGSKFNQRILSLLKTGTVKKRTIVIGLKSDNSSREMLLRSLTSVVKPGDNVLAVHVQEPGDKFDPNTFHIHEDICKSKQVDFEVKICAGNSFIAELSYQVRVNLATILIVGCSTPWPRDATVTRYLKELPPTCSLLVMDSVGKILVQMQGTSQQGSASRMFQSSVSPSVSTSNGDPGTRTQMQKLATMHSTQSPQPGRFENTEFSSVKKKMQLINSVLATDFFQRIATVEVKGYTRRFTAEEIRHATNGFSHDMLIGEGGHSLVYRANFRNGQVAAVKVIKSLQYSEEDLIREVEILSGLRHENIVQLLGYCYSREIHAVVYYLLEQTLRQKLKELKWSERMRVAVGVAKALDYLHSCSPSIIHRDVKSTNILVWDNGTPQLSDFGAAVTYHQTQQASPDIDPLPVVGTFGYLAPEYVMYGKIDEKIDVYSYGVVLLELITGREAIETSSTYSHESLVLWARSLLNCGLSESLIDPNLNGKYDRDEMEKLMIAARLCLLPSSSRRPRMEKILQLFEEPGHHLELQTKREELQDRIDFNSDQIGFPIQEDPDQSENLQGDSSYSL